MICQEDYNRSVREMHDFARKMQMQNEETLRDRFAMAALTGLLSANATYGGRTNDWGAIAKDCFAHADAMLEARGKK